VDTYFITREWR